MQIIEYKIIFTYTEIHNLLWSDNFELNSEWEILRIKHTKTIQKSYMNRSPYIEPKQDYNIALYTKNQWICFDTKANKGSFISNSKEEIKIPNINIIDYNCTPYLVNIKSEFDFHIMMTLLTQRDNIKILEFKRPALTEALIIANDLKIEIYDSLFSYKGDKIKEFNELVQKLLIIYEKESEEIKILFSKLDESIPKTKYTHKALAYKTWYKAKRENQSEWPLISITKQKNSIEFPKNSGIYYYYPNKYVGLAKRNDNNDEIFIPKIYRTNHLENKKSYLYNYLNDTQNNLQKIKIPHSLNNKCPYKLKYSRKRQYLNNQPYQEINEEGEIIITDIKPEVLIYQNIILANINQDYSHIKLKAQLIDKENKRIMILTLNDKWIESKGPRLRNIITIPYNYKQIIHDYNKLGRLKSGKIMDLSHIGIVNEKDDDIITWPIKDELYISKTLETHRLMTFKYQKFVKITHI